MRVAATCDSQEFCCICGRKFEEREDAVRHVEQLHCSEFDATNLDEVESAIESRITPSPLQAMPRLILWNQ
jgi:hypothetical protein